MTIYGLPSFWGDLYRECDAGFTLGCMSCRHASHVSCPTVQLVWKHFRNVTVFNSLTHHSLFAFCCFFIKKTTHQYSTPTTLAAIPRWSFRRKNSRTHLSKVIQLTFIWKTEEFNEAAQCWHHLEKNSSGRRGWSPNQGLTGSQSPLD